MGHQYLQWDELPFLSFFLFFLFFFLPSPIEYWRMDPFSWMHQQSLWSRRNLHSKRGLLHLRLQHWISKYWRNLRGEYGGFPLFWTLHQSSIIVFLDGCTSNPCGGNATCTPGSGMTYTCSCNTGYQTSGSLCVGKTFLFLLSSSFNFLNSILLSDCNECAGQCGGNVCGSATCVNTVGSYYCLCSSVSGTLWNAMSSTCAGQPPIHTHVWNLTLSFRQLLLPF